MPDAAARIRDTPLREIPELPVGDRDYNRRQELRITTRKRNAINRIDRHRVVMSERTAIFTAIYEAAEQTAPMFARELKEACDYAQLDATLAGYFDDPSHTPLHTQSSFRRSQEQGRCRFL